MAKTVLLRAGAKELEQDQQQGPWRSLRILLPVGYVSAIPESRNVASKSCRNWRHFGFKLRPRAGSLR